MILGHQRSEDTGVNDGRLRIAKLSHKTKNERFSLTDYGVPNEIGRFEWRARALPKASCEIDQVDRANNLQSKIYGRRAGQDHMQSQKCGGSENHATQT